MFIRSTFKKNKKTGKKYNSYQLVESFRTSSGPRQKIITTIGSDIDLNAEERKELANRIEDIVKGSSSLFTCPDYIENLAQHFAKLLLQKNSLVKSLDEIPKENPDYHRVDINSIRHTSVRTIGCEHIAYYAYQELGFDDLFNRLKFTPKQKVIAAAAIIGRALFPLSERALHDRLKSRSGLDELLQTSFAKLSLDKLYLISDDLYSSKKAIEKHLREREQTLFNLKETIILYDITNTYFEGKCKGNSKAKRGKSKEMRSDCPLIAVGVVLDAEGFPKHSEFFQGNINERATLQDMISRLNKFEMRERPIIVLDSGIATKDNITWLKSESYAYIVMMKKKERPLIEDCQEVILRQTQNQFISATLTYDKATDDHFLKCYSQERLKKEKDIQKHKTNGLEQALNYLKEGLPKSGRIKTIEKVHQKIGRFREKYARLAQHYDIVVHPAKDGKTVQDITWNCNEMDVNRSFSGTYTLRTNVKDLSQEKIWEIYVMLNEAESCFRCLKSETGLRPNWHSREDRVDGHIFLSLLAYHLIVTIRRKLKKHGICDSWETIREKVQSHAIVKTNLITEQDAIYLRQTSEPDEYQKLIYQSLGISLKPLKAEKTIIKKDVVSKI